MGGHGIVGGQIPLGAGFAFAAKYRQTDQVSLTYFGEAAANIGSFHETLNIAGLWKLPAIFVIENNGYGMGTAVQRAAAITDLYRRAASYDMPGVEVDGQDVVAVREATDAAVARARAGDGPTLLEIKTFRYMGHSMSDAASGTYRSKEELEPVAAARSDRAARNPDARARHCSTTPDSRTIEAAVADRGRRRGPVRRRVARSGSVGIVDRCVCVTSDARCARQEIPRCARGEISRCARADDPSLRSGSGRAFGGEIRLGVRWPS